MEPCNDKLSEVEIDFDRRLIRLEGEVEQLQKEMSLLANFALILGMAALVYALRWYQEKVGTIPGVLP